MIDYLYGFPLDEKLFRLFLDLELINCNNDPAIECDCNKYSYSEKDSEYKYGECIYSLDCMTNFSMISIPHNITSYTNGQIYFGITKAISIGRTEPIEISDTSLVDQLIAKYNLPITAHHELIPRNCQCCS